MNHATYRIILMKFMTEKIFHTFVTTTTTKSEQNKNLKIKS